MVIFKENDLRISLLTPRLLRTEKGAFCDLPTQTVVARDFGDVKYTLHEDEKYILSSKKGRTYICFSMWSPFVILSIFIFNFYRY